MALAAANQPFAISALTVHLLMYYGRKEGSPDSFLHRLIEQYQVLPLQPVDIAWAFEHERGTDFEDTLQVSIALRANCDGFMTLDKQLAKHHQSAITMVTV